MRWIDRRLLHTTRPSVLAKRNLHFIYDFVSPGTVSSHRIGSSAVLEILLAAFRRSQRNTQSIASLYANHAAIY